MFYFHLFYKTNHRYFLRTRRHHEQLADKSNNRFSNNFTVRITRVIDLCISCVLITFYQEEEEEEEQEQEQELYIYLLCSIT